MAAFLACESTKKNASETFNMKKITLEISLYTYYNVYTHTQIFIFSCPPNIVCSVFRMKLPPPRGAPHQKGTNTRTVQSKAATARAQHTPSEEPNSTPPPQPPAPRPSAMGEELAGHSSMDEECKERMVLLGRVQNLFRRNQIKHKKEPAYTPVSAKLTKENHPQQQQQQQQLSSMV